MITPNYTKFSSYLFLVIILYASLVMILLHFEQMDANSNITNLGEAMWYSVVTLTTVGYGDYTPITLGGRLVGLVFLALSLSIYGLLIGQITNFMDTVKENQRLGYTGTDFENHTVIIGWNSYGKAVVDQLVAVGQKVAVVTNIQNDIDLIRENYNKTMAYILFAEYTNFELIAKTNIRKASNVFVNLKDDTEKLVYILNLKKAFGELKMVVMLDNSDLKNTFHSAGTTYAVSKNEISSKLLASYIFEPDVAAYSEDIMSFTEDDEDHDIKQYKIIKTNPFLGKDYNDVFHSLKKKCNSVLIGISKKRLSSYRLIKNPSEDVKIELGDYLILITSNKSQDEVDKIFQIKEGLIND